MKLSKIKIIKHAELKTKLPIYFYIVAVPPDILDYPTSTDMVVTEGSNVTLRCAATGKLLKRVFDFFLGSPYPTRGLIQ